MVQDRIAALEQTIEQLATRLAVAELGLAGMLQPLRNLIMHSGKAQVALVAIETILGAVVAHQAHTTKDPNRTIDALLAHAQGGGDEAHGDPAFDADVLEGIDETMARVRESAEGHLSLLR